jgi:hypothetical protein
MALKEAIKTIEDKGYIVKEYANMSMGIVSETCPAVYEIMKPDYSTVYSASGISPNCLSYWAETLPQLTEAKTPAIKAFDAAADADRRKKEREYDEMYNEGGDGYNPYRG